MINFQTHFQSRLRALAYQLLIISATATASIPDTELSTQEIQATLGDLTTQQEQPAVPAAAGNSLDLTKINSSTDQRQLDFSGVERALSQAQDSLATATTELAQAKAAANQALNQAEAERDQARTATTKLEHELAQARMERDGLRAQVAPASPITPDDLAQEPTHELADNEIPQDVVSIQAE